MAQTTQNRLPLEQSTQQHATRTVATLLCRQIAALATASFTANPQKDEFPVNTAGGDITVTMPPGAQCFPGKPYRVRKKHADNTLTVAFSGGELYEGAATIELDDDDALAEFMFDGSEWVRASAAGVGGDVPAGVAAIDGSNITGADLTAFQGTLGAVLNADEHCLGPFKLSLVGTDADEMRFQAPYDLVITTVQASQIKGAIATGAAVATLTVGGVAPTANTINHAIADAAGTKKTMTPTGAAVTVTAGTEIRIAITGTNDAAGSAAGYTIKHTRT